LVSGYTKEKEGETARSSFGKSGETQGKGRGGREKRAVRLFNDERPIREGKRRGKSQTWVVPGRRGGGKDHASHFSLPTLRKKEGRPISGPARQGEKRSG